MHEPLFLQVIVHSSVTVTAEPPVTTTPSWQSLMVHPRKMTEVPSPEAATATGQFLKVLLTAVSLEACVAIRVQLSKITVSSCSSPVITTVLSCSPTKHA
jgi:transcription initiation factor TFIID subunit TAF12